jgi:hypothetical protein
MEFLVTLGEELLRRFERRAVAGRIYSRLEITGRGFTLGAETVLARMGRNARGRPCLALADEPRVLALLSTAYGRPVAAHAVTKMRRAAELWNEGEKALAHIHIAHIGLPACGGKDQMLRLFLAEECLAAGVTPAELIAATVSGKTHRRALRSRCKRDI